MNSRIAWAANRCCRRRAVALGLAASAVALLTGWTPAAANSDPHRTYEPLAPIDLPTGYCAFPVHLDWVANKEYASVTVFADGSTAFVTTGALIAEATNVVTGKTVKVNASGPGTITVSADGSALTYDVQGLLILPASNLTALGFPSNLVVTSGPARFVQASGLGPIVSMDATPHLLYDVCAALA